MDPSAVTRPGAPPVDDVDPFAPSALAAAFEVLAPGQRAFALAYLANGFNASAAYRTAHAGVTEGTARVEGCRTLAHPNVRKVLAPLLERHWKGLQMDGEEALARVARIARLDPRLLYNDQGVLLSVNQWPDEVVGCVRGMQDGPYGLKVALESPMQALRTILEQTGKIRPLADSIDALAAALLADKEAHAHIPPPKD